MMVDLESAIARFLETARQLQADPSLTAKIALERMTQDYRHIRIDDTELDNKGDTLLLECGASYSFIVDRPVDMRYPSGDEVSWYSESRHKFINFTRRVNPTGNDDEAEFDDVAVQLQLTLLYGKATGDEPRSNQWIDNPGEIEQGIARFCQVPFVRGLLEAPVSRLVAVVDYCG